MNKHHTKFENRISCTQTKEKMSKKRGSTMRLVTILYGTAANKPDRIYRQQTHKITAKSTTLNVVYGNTRLLADQIIHALELWCTNMIPVWYTLDFYVLQSPSGPSVDHILLFCSHDPFLFRLVASLCRSSWILYDACIYYSSVRDAVLSLFYVDA